MGFDFEIHYKSGASNKVADALSRQSHTSKEFSSLITTGGTQWDEVRRVIQTDPFITKIMADLNAGLDLPKGYVIDHGVLKFKGRIVLPPNCSLISRLLHLYHDTPMGGHSGELKTYQRIAATWFWTGMRKAVAHYVQCASKPKHQTSNQQAYLIPYPFLLRFGMN